MSESEIGREHMDVYMVVLRVVHVLAGVFWVGASLTFSLIAHPVANEEGPAAGVFMTTSPSGSCPTSSPEREVSRSSPAC